MIHRREGRRGRWQRQALPLLISCAFILLLSLRIAKFGRVYTCLKCICQHWLRLYSRVSIAWYAAATPSLTIPYCAVHFLSTASSGLKDCALCLFMHMDVVQDGWCSSKLAQR